MPCQRMFSRVCFLSLSSSAASAVVSSCCRRRLAMLFPEPVELARISGKARATGSVELQLRSATPPGTERSRRDHGGVCAGETNSVFLAGDVSVVAWPDE